MRNNAEIALSPLTQVRSKVADYATLMKPELTSLSVLTALCGFYLAADSFNFMGFLWVGAGTLLLGGGAGALNQYIERDHDRLMRRTEKRPLPAGRLTPRSARNFGVALSLMGLAALLIFTTPLAGFLGGLTILSYLAWYTPLKRVTPLSTLVGAIPGALPPLIGWTAATGTISVGGWVLFLILFFWQMPHFLSLAWMYRKDYARAGYRMLSVIDSDGSRTGLHIMIHTSLLVLVSLLLPIAGLAGEMYTIGAVGFGLSFFVLSALFRYSSGKGASLEASRTNQYSRYLFFASLLYLPALMFLMTIDKL